MPDKGNRQISRQIGNRQISRHFMALLSDISQEPTAFRLFTAPSGDMHHLGCRKLSLYVGTLCGTSKGLPNAMTAPGLQGKANLLL